MVAQGFPSFLRVACAGKDARLGPVPDTLEALNQRAWSLGHHGVPSPTPPRYVSVVLRVQSVPSHSLSCGGPLVRHCVSLTCTC